MLKVSDSSRTEQRSLHADPPLLLTMLLPGIWIVLPSALPLSTTPLTPLSVSSVPGGNNGYVRLRPYPAKKRLGFTTEKSK